jgi:hypothetical protein
MKEQQPGDVVVSTGFVERFFEFLSVGDLNNFIRYSYVSGPAEEVIFNAIETHPHGWIVLDGAGGYILSRPVPLEDFVHAGKEVHYLGWFGDAYILKWGD